MLQDELLPEEQILWSGQPDASVIFTKADAIRIPFSLLWGGFACFWEYMALGGVRGMNLHNSPDAIATIFPLFGIPFVLMGLYFVFGRFFYKRYMKLRTYYVLTNKRVLAFTGKDARKLRAVRLDTLSNIEKNIDPSGFGTVIFGNKSPMAFFDDSGMEFFNRQYGEPTMAFFGIREARQVYDIANRLVYEKHS
jgi:hypothetical protein